MSMTKRHIDSLTQAEQDEVYGAHNPDEWHDSAENEPDVAVIEPPVGPDDYPDYGDWEC